MESAKIPMRGKVKDAEAEALLKLLRQEKEFGDHLSAPQIQQRIPLPAIRSRSSNNKPQQTRTFDRTDPTFTTQTLHCSPLISNVEIEKELISDSKFLWTTPKPASNCNGRRSLLKKDIYVPPYSFQEEQALSYSKFSRQCKKMNSRTLPPLEIPISPSFDLPERPSCPISESSKFCDELPQSNGRSSGCGSEYLP